jgi:predicted transcriptional regulator
MLSQAQRTTILELNTKGVSKREIARVLEISRVAVRKVLRSNSTEVPELQRPEKAEPYRQQILELFSRCKGNLVRVHEELIASGAEMSYPALTAFCRRHAIGQAPPAPAGIAVRTNRYSVPLEWIGRRVEVRETRNKVEIQLDARRLVTHRRIADAEHQRVMLAEHRPPRGQRASRPDPHPEEKTIVTAVPELADYVTELKQRSRKVVTLALRQLLRLVREYPREPLLGAVREAARYGLYDLDRLERMILRRVAREYFLLDEGPHGDD